MAARKRSALTGWRMQNWLLAMFLLGLRRVRSYAAQRPVRGRIGHFSGEALRTCYFGRVETPWLANGRPGTRSHCIVNKSRFEVYKQWP